MSKLLPYSRFYPHAVAVFLLLQLIGTVVSQRWYLGWGIMGYLGILTPLVVGLGVFLVFVLAVTIWTQLTDPKSKKTYGLCLINVIAGLFLFYVYTLGIAFLPFGGYPRY